MIEQKQKHPKLKWSRVPVILTSNKLPKVMREPKQFQNEADYEFRERHHNFRAFMSRCKLTEIQKSHKNNEQFPYTADELAWYMQHLCNTMEPIIEDESLSDQSEEFILPKR